MLYSIIKTNACITKESHKINLIVREDENMSDIIDILVKDKVEVITNSTLLLNHKLTLDIEKNSQNMLIWNWS